MVLDVLINYSRALPCTKLEKKNASLWRWAAYQALFLSASTPPFCTLFCDAKVENLQTTFVHWKRGLWFFQNSGQIKMINAVTNNHTRCFVLTQMVPRRDSYFCLHLGVITMLPCSVQMEKSYIVLRTHFWLNTFPVSLLSRSPSCTSCWIQRLSRSQMTCLGLLCSFLIVAFFYR